MKNYDFNTVLKGLYITTKQFLKAYEESEELITDTTINGCIDELRTFVNAYDIAMWTEEANIPDEEGTTVPSDTTYAAKLPENAKETILPEDIGECVVKDGKVVSLRKEYCGQGYIFKSWRAFYDTNNPNRPCYVPELDEPAEEEEPDIWTRKRFLDICDGDERIADAIFSLVDWQSPYTELDQLFAEKELDRCGKCGKMFLSYKVDRCPHCGAPYDPEEEDDTPKKEKKYFVSYSGSTIVFAENEDDACEIAADNISLDEINARLIKEDGTLE